LVQNNREYDETRHKRKTCNLVNRKKRYLAAVEFRKKSPAVYFGKDKRRGFLSFMATNLESPQVEHFFAKFSMGREKKSKGV